MVECWRIRRTVGPDSPGYFAPMATRGPHYPSFIPSDATRRHNDLLWLPFTAGTCLLIASPLVQLYFESAVFNAVTVRA